MATAREYKKGDPGSDFGIKKMLDWRRCFEGFGLIVFCLMMLFGCAGAPFSVSISPTSAMLLPGQAFQFHAIRTGGAAISSQTVFLVDGVVGGTPSTGTITSGGLYTAPAKASGQQIEVGIQGVSGSAAVTIFNSASFTAGSVVTTQNPLVASYSIAAPVGASVQVQFGPDTNYGFSTSIVPAPANGGAVTVLVAGMRAATIYHMQALVDLLNGSQLLDKDHTFTTGSIPADRIPDMTAAVTGVATPSDGIELFSLIPYAAGNLLSAVATDLAGNVIWYYDIGSTAADAFPVKPLPNGHMMILVAPAPGLTGPNEIREVDLAGNIINTISISAINKGLSGIASFQIVGLHHDFAILPNGHLILLGNYSKTINNVTGIPAGTIMTGDALVDWDPQKGPVWTWSTFDHLGLTHAPYGFADWTHSNAIIYSPDDGNLILSMRNQNWVIKINYQNGEGDGSILWRLGLGGDYTLPGAPSEWNYGQHYVTIQSPNSSGVFSLMFFNNGNNRVVDSNGDICGSSGVSACYSSVPIMQLDEDAKTASVLWEDDLLPSYSICCGDALVLPNGDNEFDIAYDVNTPNFSHIEEVTPAKALVWKLDVEGQLAYRGYRIPSLYPGQVWPAVTQSSATHVNPAGRSKNGTGAISIRTIEQLP